MWDVKIACVNKGDWLRNPADCHARVSKRKVLELKICSIRHSSVYHCLDFSNNFVVYWTITICLAYKLLNICRDIKFRLFIYFVSDNRIIVKRYGIVYFRNDVLRESYFSLIFWVYVFFPPKKLLLCLLFTFCSNWKVSILHSASN